MLRGALAYIGRLARTAVSGFIDHDDVTWAASIAYYTALSIAPLLLLALWGASLVMPSAGDQLIDQIGLLTGSVASDALRTIAQSAGHARSIGGVAGVLGIGVLVVGATSVFSQLQSSLNAILEDARRPATTGNVLLAWLRRRLLSIGILAALGFILIVSLVMSTFLTLLPHGNGVAWLAINDVVTFAVFCCLFAALFKFLPEARLSWRHTWAGAFITAALFTAGKFLIALYLVRSGLGESYGPAGALVLMLVWVFYSSLIFLFGAEIVQADMVLRGTLRKKGHG
jgi:membrane protein